MDIKKTREALDYVENQPWPPGTEFSIATMLSDNIIRFAMFPSKETAKEVRKIVGTCRKRTFEGKPILEGYLTPDIRIDIWWPTVCKKVKTRVETVEEEVPVKFETEYKEKEIWDWECPKVLLEE